MFTSDALGYLKWESLSTTFDILDTGISQLANFTKRKQGVKLGATKNKSSEQQSKELNPGPQEYKSSALTSPPQCLQ